MKFICVDENRLVFEFQPDERESLESLLKCYPLPSQWNVELVRDDHKGEFEEDRKFLEETLEAEKKAMASGLNRFLESPSVFFEDLPEEYLRIPLDQVDWFLQILNDLRVSAWQLLGCPDQDEKQELEDMLKKEMPAEMMQRMQLFILLEMAGYYQSVVLDAVMER